MDRRARVLVGLKSCLPHLRWVGLLAALLGSIWIIGTTLAAVLQLPPQGPPPPLRGRRLLPEAGVLRLSTASAAVKAIPDAPFVLQGALVNIPMIGIPSAFRISTLRYRCGTAFQRGGVVIANM